jgi:hypothetical protein
MGGGARGEGAAAQGSGGAGADPLEAAALISATLDDDEAAARAGGSGRPWGDVAPGSAAYRVLAHVNESVGSALGRGVGAAAAGALPVKTPTTPRSPAQAAAHAVRTAPTPSRRGADQVGGVGRRVCGAAGGAQRVGGVGGRRRRRVVLPVQGARPWGARWRGGVARSSSLLAEA